MPDADVDQSAVLADLLARVQRLEDERAVTRVVTRYGFAVDLGDAEATADLYTDDAELDLGPTSRFSGREGVRALVLDERHQEILGRCAHTLGPLVVTVDGDRATATGYVRVYVGDPETGEPQLWRLSCTELGLVREGSTWRIARRRSRSLGADDGAEVLRSGL